MSSIDDKIARAEEYQESTRVFKDVSLTLDAGDAVVRAELIESRDALEQERKAILNPIDKRLARTPDTTDIDNEIAAVKQKLAAVEATERGTLAIVRVYRVPGELWPEITLRHPMRADVPADASLGYNITDVTKHVIRVFGRMRENDQELELTEEQWNKVFVLIGGRQFEDLQDAVYGLNVSQPDARAERLKNSFEAATASAKK